MAKYLMKFKIHSLSNRSQFQNFQLTFVELVFDQFNGQQAKKCGKDFSEPAQPFPKYARVITQLSGEKKVLMLAHIFFLGSNSISLRL